VDETVRERNRAGEREKERENFNRHRPHIRLLYNSLHADTKRVGGDLGKQFASFCFTQPLLCLVGGVLCLLLGEIALLLNPFQRSCVRLKEKDRKRQSESGERECARDSERECVCERASERVSERVRERDLRDKVHE
jgi:hypothetical protein